LNQNSAGFRDFIFDTGLIDLGFKGPTYTWTNKPNSSKALHIRLDRVIASPTWCNIFPETCVNHMPRTRRSDHALIMLRTREGTKGGGKFRIEHWWMENETFQVAWEVDWSANPEEAWEDKYNAMRMNIKHWRKKVKTP
jgi:hypothetical protein